jgi:hypothetical protein
MPTTIAEKATRAITTGSDGQRKTNTEIKTNLYRPSPREVPE